MHEQDIQQQLNEQQQALAKIYKSVEKTRKYIMWSGIFSLAVFVIPAIIAVFAIPKILRTFTGGLANDGLDKVSSISTQSLSNSLNTLKDLGL